ncbi:L-threonine 3-dehydrogenase [Microbacterium rhizosphaerae]|uniref:L-threonine 3-dehydrogenase n=1 Tax=Microbacterium rhizosphaerae TaxID=1678237 RepID=A0ABZ0SNR5_9MICO|nr:L-threonine 3-dehydrogenase [Microbacterium rhizosphaerae]WPR89825.1 L-threonine 3-dehydrogenase [Microbacterium rhizosphaerae]
MKALLKPAPGPGFEWVERPEPQIGPADVKIRVLRTGICGTDLHILGWDDWAASTIRTPLIPGHEFSGEVVEVGELVHDISVGDLVSGEGHIVCGMCRNCRAGRRQMCIRTQGIGLHRDGAFAEYIVIPGANVWVHHTAIDHDVAAIFDPLGNAVHTALAFSVVGEDVLVTGCGPIGLMAIAVARHAGARFIVATDISRTRLDLAKGMGADAVVDVSRDSIGDVQHALKMREGFDIGLEMSGAPSALSSMIDNMTHGGRIAMLGLPSEPFPIDWGKVVTHMLTLKGIYGREMFETWNSMSAMMQTSQTLRERVASTISDRYPAHEWEQAFAAAKSGGVGKVILDWTQV